MEDDVVERHPARDRAVEDAPALLVVAAEIIEAERPVAANVRRPKRRSAAVSATGPRTASSAVRPDADIGFPLLRVERPRL